MENQRFRKRGEPEVYERNPESEVFEGSHGFEKAVRGSGGQQGIQEEG